MVAPDVTGTVYTPAATSRDATLDALMDVSGAHRRMSPRCPPAGSVGVTYTSPTVLAQGAARLNEVTAETVCAGGSAVTDAPGSMDSGSTAHPASAAERTRGA